MSVAISFASATASAQVLYQGGGDYAVAPMYHSMAIQGYADVNQPFNWFFYENGIEYVSNTAPQFSTSVNETIQRNGATIQSAGTSIYNGFYSARNFVSMNVENAQETDGYYTFAGRGSRTTVEFFTLQATPVRTTFRWRVTGTENAPVGEATSRIDFLAGSHADKDYNFLFEEDNGALSEFGPGEYVYTLESQLQTPIDLFFWASAYAQIDQGQATQGDNYLLTADYGSTYEMIEIQLFDADDNLIPEWNMMDHARGTVVFNQDGPVPEPSSMVLLLAGAATLIRRRA